MKFTSKLVSKAWEIFKKICPKNASVEAMKNYLSHAYKVAFKWLKSLIKGQIIFWKLSTEEIEVREVMEVDEVFSPKTGREVPKAMFTFIDKVKYLAGEFNPVISINQFQLL